MVVILKKLDQAKLMKAKNGLSVGMNLAYIEAVIEEITEALNMDEVVEYPGAFRLAVFFSENQQPRARWTLKGKNP